jgi:hypothetical protein
LKRQIVALWHFLNCKSPVGSSIWSQKHKTDTFSKKRLTNKNIFLNYNFFRLFTIRCLFSQHVQFSYLTFNIWKVRSTFTNTKLPKIRER